MKWVTILEKTAKMCYNKRAVKNNYTKILIYLLGRKAIMDEKKLISRFSSKLFLERVRILNSYATKTQEQGKMYYVYSKSVTSTDFYNVCECADEHFYTFAVTPLRDLPKGTHVGSVLRRKSDGIYLDEVATEEIEKSFSKKMKEILDEQEKYFKKRRIEDHIYIVSEKYSESICLYDITYENKYSEEIEEILFTKEMLSEAYEGYVYRYKNGMYRRLYNF